MSALIRTVSCRELKVSSDDEKIGPFVELAKQHYAQDSELSPAAYLFKLLHSIFREYVHHVDKEEGVRQLVEKNLSFIILSATADMKPNQFLVLRKVVNKAKEVTIYQDTYEVHSAPYTRFGFVIEGPAGVRPETGRAFFYGPHCLKSFLTAHKSAEK